MASVSSAQPNVPGRGIVASYSPRFWMLVVLIGVAAGVGGAALIGLLHAVQHLAWSYEHGHFLEGVERSSDARRVLVLACGGVIAGVGAIGLARLGGGDVSEALWLRAGRLPLLGSFARAVESIVIVGLGASLGREAAPQQVGAAVAALAERLGASAQSGSAGCSWHRGRARGWRRYTTSRWAARCSRSRCCSARSACRSCCRRSRRRLVATAVAWVALGRDRPTSFPPTTCTPRRSSGRCSWARSRGSSRSLYVRLITGAHALRPAGWRRVAAPIAVFTALGVVAIAYPQVLGNGKGVVQLALVGRLAVGVMAVLIVLKPLATAGCLGSGAPGGLFTPTLTFGVRARRRAG